MIHVFKEIGRYISTRKRKEGKEEKRKEGRTGERKKWGREEGRKKSTKYPDNFWGGMRWGIRVKYHSYNMIKACN